MKKKEWNEVVLMLERGMSSNVRRKWIAYQNYFYKRRNWEKEYGINLLKAEKKAAKKMKYGCPDDEQKDLCIYKDRCARVTKWGGLYCDKEERYEKCDMLCYNHMYGCKYKDSCIEFAISPMKRTQYCNRSCGHESCEQYEFHRKNASDEATQTLFRKKR